MRRQINLHAAALRAHGGILWVYALLAIAALGAFAAPAAAQPAPQLGQSQVFNAFTLVGRITDISATTSTSNTAFGSLRAPVAMIFNTGSNWGYVALGALATTVTVANGIPVPPNSCVVVNANGMSNIAAITSTSTTTLQVALGTGSGCR